MGIPRAGTRAAWLAAVQLLTAVPLAGCHGRARERVTIATTHVPALGLVFVAEAKGYFAAHGVTVERKVFTTGRDALAALSAHEADLATAFDSPVARGAVTDPDLRVLTTLHVSGRNTCLLARADSGIRRVEDLAGKRAGAPRDTNGEHFLNVLLACSTAPERHPEIVDVAPERSVDALVSGEIDALAIWEPHLERARHLLGPGRSVEICSDIYSEMSLLATRGDVVASRRAALVKVLSALADAERFVRERPDEAWATLRSEFPELPEDQFREAWGRVRLELGVTHRVAEALERGSEWLRGTGRAVGPPVNLARTLVPEILAEVDQEAVTFVSPAGARLPR